jgi:hypothetical protein
VSLTQLETRKRWQVTASEQWQKLMGTFWPQRDVERQSMSHFSLSSPFIFSAPLGISGPRTPYTVFCYVHPSPWFLHFGFLQDHLKASDATGRPKSSVINATFNAT